MRHQVLLWNKAHRRIIQKIKSERLTNHEQCQIPRKYVVTWSIGKVPIIWNYPKYFKIIYVLENVPCNYGNMYISMDSGFICWKSQILSRLLKYINQNAIIVSSFFLLRQLCVSIDVMFIYNIYKWVGTFLPDSFSFYFEIEHKAKMERFLNFSYFGGFVLFLYFMEGILDASLIFLMCFLPCLLFFFLNLWLY